MAGSDMADSQVLTGSSCFTLDSRETHGDGSAAAPGANVYIGVRTMSNELATLSCSLFQPVLQLIHKALWCYELIWSAFTEY